MRFWPFKKPLLELLGIFDPEFDRVMNAIEAEERRHWMAEEHRKASVAEDERERSHV